jgi:hypothetical protein
LYLVHRGPQDSFTILSAEKTVVTYVDPLRYDNP